MMRKFPADEEIMILCQCHCKYGTVKSTDIVFGLHCAINTITANITACTSIAAFSSLVSAATDTRLRLQPLSKWFLLPFLAMVRAAQRPTPLLAPVIIKLRFATDTSRSAALNFLAAAS